MKLQAFALLFVVQMINQATCKGKVACRSCLSSSYSFQSSGCYDNPNNESSFLCPHHRFYCRTEIFLKNGFPEMIQRGCVDPLTDHDQTTLHTPRYSHCTTDVDEDTYEEKTRCFYPCHANNCNNITINVLRSCKGDCSAELGNGHCDYVTGLCICKKGWYGSNCQQSMNLQPQTSNRKCVQCNDEIDRECSTKTLATPCPLESVKYNHCSVTRTSIFDSKQKIVRSYMSKGCTKATHLGNKCYFSTPSHRAYSDHPQYTCISVCGIDGCNAGAPSGNPSFPEEQNLHCLVCESTMEDGDCAKGYAVRQLCSSNTNYCKSTATYLISENTNLRYKSDPEYKFDKIVRGCASYAVKTKCVTQRIETLNAKFVTCQETCGDDGCNTGWPARPKCAQCDSNYSSEGYDSCLETPEWPKQCPKPYQGYCVVTEYRGRSIDNSMETSGGGFRRLIRRGCSYHDVGTSCKDVIFRGINVTNCNKTCTNTGCNLGLFNISSGQSSKEIKFTTLIISIFCFILYLESWIN